MAELQVSVESVIAGKGEPPLCAFVHEADRTKKEGARVKRVKVLRVLPEDGIETALGVKPVSIIGNGKG